MADIHSEKKIEIPQKLPLLPVRDVVVFPYMVIPLSVGRQKSIKALDEAMAKGRLIVLAAQKQAAMEEPQMSDIYEVGTVCEILQMLKMGDGTIKLFVEGVARVKIEEYLPNQEYFEVRVQRIISTYQSAPELEALMRNVVTQFEQYVKLNRRLPIEMVLSVNNIENPDVLADTISAHLSIKIKDKQEMLALTEPLERLNRLLLILNSENEILGIERKIQGRVRQQIEKSQKEYYLSEQMKAIQKELKQKDEYGKELDELARKIKEAKMTKEAEEKAREELTRLEKMMPYSPEATVVRTYLDWLVNLPWAIKTADNMNLAHAEGILNAEHFGLEKAKERISEYLAVCQLSGKIKGPILCFVGPPGTGKTSLGRSIAHAMGRKFIRISLGGVRDEAEIRGHRRTYIGSLPGRIIQSMRKAKSRNPVFLLDEVDKIGVDFRGDPAAALLEVLDPEQNHTFNDHYLEIDFDLSDVLFITTANTLYSIPSALLDRMEVINFPGYTTEEKIQIANQFIVPKQLKENGLKKDSFTLDDDMLKAVILEYTREAGVRNLEREIAGLCRKVAKKIVKEKIKKVTDIHKANIHKYLGIPKFHPEYLGENEVGAATGLAWTEVGGDVLSIEVLVMKGKGKFTLTGKLGDVMQESAQAALGYIRANAHTFKIPTDFMKDKEIHIHVPEGAIPKDGPSAGITMATAVLSALTNKPVKKNVAMTGEITLLGHVLPIGGLKEKVLAAYRTGIKTVIIPKDNKKDMEEIPPYVQKKIKFVLVKHISEVFAEAIVGLKK